jgi:hypothetical protein
MRRIRRTLLQSLLLCVALAGLGVGVANAQPMAERHGAPHGGLSVLGLLLEPNVHASLGLSSVQEAQWATLQTAARTLHSQTMSARAALQVTIAAEFAKSTPDLAAIDNAVAAEHVNTAAAIAAVRAQALALYASFSTGQQAIVITAARARYQRMQQAHRGPGAH